MFFYYLFIDTVCSNLPYFFLQTFVVDYIIFKKLKGKCMCLKDDDPTQMLYHKIDVETKYSTRWLPGQTRFVLSDSKTEINWNNHNRNCDSKELNNVFTGEDSITISL